MYKFIFSVALGVVFAFPTAASAQDCGCAQPAPVCQKTRKKLALATFKKEVCRLQVQCVTDECGCTKRKLVKVKKCVDRKRLVLVDVPVDPCAPKCLERLRGKLRGLMQGCNDGCNDCCDPEPQPFPTPAADCGCNG